MPDMQVLDKKSLTEMKSFTTPPKDVENVAVRIPSDNPSTNTLRTCIHCMYIVVGVGACLCSNQCCRVLL